MAIILLCRVVIVIEFWGDRGVLEVDSGPFVKFTCCREQSREVEKVRWHYNSVGIDSRINH